MNSFAGISRAFLLTLFLAGNTSSLFGRDSTNDDDGVVDWTLGGHTKYQYIHTLVPADSVVQAVGGDSLQDHNLEARLNVSMQRQRWDITTHFQFIAVYSDTLAGLGDLSIPVIPGAGQINDDQRWFDLTHEFKNSGKKASLVRLDRLSVSYSGDKTVLRFGRQAVSWGNGLLFTPMDILNPFDPTAVDKEYKTGDDMLYGQYLLDNGNDVQAVAVVRRNPANGDVEQDSSSVAIKYHGFWGSSEFDFLAAEHYADHVVGLGLSSSLGGAVWRGDLVWTDTVSDSVLSVVAGTSYSGVAGGRNWTGLLEYYYNGFGQPDGQYSLTELSTNPELVNRLARGELFNLGRHYLGVSVMLELTPLFKLTPNLFINLTDPSALAQVVFAYDWKQDVQLLGSLNIPVGPNGSEFGGIEATQAGMYVSTGASLFAQLAWYF